MISIFIITYTTCNLVQVFIFDRVLFLFIFHVFGLPENDSHQFMQTKRSGFSEKKIMLFPRDVNHGFAKNSGNGYNRTGSPAGFIPYTVVQVPLSKAPAVCAAGFLYSFV